MLYWKKNSLYQEALYATNLLKWLLIDDKMKHFSNMVLYMDCELWLRNKKRLTSFPKNCFDDIGWFGLICALIYLNGFVYSIK